MTETVERAWLDVADAAQYTGAGQSTIRTAAASGELRGVQKSARGRWAFRRADLDRWVEGLPARGGQ